MKTELINSETKEAVELIIEMAKEESYEIRLEIAADLISYLVNKEQDLE